MSPTERMPQNAVLAFGAGRLLKLNYEILLKELNERIEYLIIIE